MTQHVPPQQRLLRPSGHAKRDEFPADRVAHPPNSPARKDRGSTCPLVFRWEPFSKISKELMPLFKRHWQEIALDQEFVPLDPDWDLYYAMEVAGKLHILTARKGVIEHKSTDRNAVDSFHKTMSTYQLVGYIFNLVGGHLNYSSTKFAHTDKYYIEPEFRKGWWPVKMFKENIVGLKEREVVISTIGFTIHFKDARVGKLLARLGYKPTDILMRKAL